MNTKSAFTTSRDADTAIKALLVGSVLVSILGVMASVIYLSQDSASLRAMPPAPARAIAAPSSGPN